MIRRLRGDAVRRLAAGVALLSGMLVTIALPCSQAAAQESPPAATTAAPALAPALDPAEMRRQIASGVRHGVLFEARRGDRRMVLYGTIHLGYEDRFPIDGTTFRELQASKAVVVELDLRRIDTLGAALLAHARLDDGKTLDSIMTAAQWVRIRAALEARGAINDTVMHSKPWIAASTLIMSEASKRGQSLQTSADVMTIALAQGFGKPVLELETAESQADALGGAPLDHQVESLLHTLDLLDSGKGDSEVFGIVDAWLAADYDQLSQCRRSMRDEQRAGAPADYAALLLDREARMVDKLETFQSQYGSLFVAIGALHLVGDDSLIDDLKQHGYTVRRL